MLLHIDGSRVLTHYIPPEHLITLLKTQAFYLIRQDVQSDPVDGKLPTACFDAPHKGEMEAIFGVNDSFLRSQAYAIDGNRARSFIMSWTQDPSQPLRELLGQKGARCWLQTSENRLKAMLGYVRTPEAEFTPPPRQIPELSSAKGRTQLIDTFYTDASQAVSVVPSYFALGHKHKQFAHEAEVRVQTDVEVVEGAALNETGICWAVTTLAPLTIGIGEKVPDSFAREIESLAQSLGVKVYGP